jgi:uncharacterized protein (DUF924 family)
MESPQTVHQFWFGSEADETAAIAAQSELWWGKNEQVDRQMRQRFADSVEQAAQGQLDHWRQHPLGLLALVLLTDQFARNIYRGSPRAFDYDVQARAWCRQALACGYDRGLRAIERMFLYLPLEHSEDRLDQAESVRLYEALLSEAPAALAPAFQGFLDYARRHRDIIERFGRFPHRNAILKRDSSAEELVFLAQPGSSF